MEFTKMRFSSNEFFIDIPKVNVLPTDPYIIKSVDGLGPVEVDVSIQKSLEQGGEYQQSRPQLRELVVLLGLNPDYTTGQTVSKLREEFYKLMSPASNDFVYVTLMTAYSSVAYAKGRISKMEINPFSQQTELQVTISCDSPYLQAVEELYLTHLEFPNLTVDNQGTAPGGFKMIVEFTANFSNWILSRASTPDFFRLNFAFEAGDQVTVNTRPGERGVSIFRDGLTYNMLGTLASGSKWLYLSAGENVFVSSTPSIDVLSVRYRPQFWGV